MTKAELLKKLADLQYTIETLEKVQEVIKYPDFKSLKLSGYLKAAEYSNIGITDFGLKIDQKETAEIIGILLAQKKYAYDRALEMLLEWDDASVITGDFF